MAQWAVFDVDGTLFPRRSLERSFLPYAVRTGAIPLGNMVRYLISVVGRGGGLKTLKSDKSFLAGLCISTIEECADSVFRARIAPAVSTRGLRTIQEYRRRGYAIMIMTGAPGFLARRVAALCQADHLVSTGLETSEGRYTGKLKGLHPYGERKREVLRALADRLDIEFSRSVVFANHHSDVPHMELFGSAVAVNPTARLHAMAEQRGWTAERWE